MCVDAQNAFWREVDCPMGGGKPGRSADGPLRPLTTFAEVEHREHIIVRKHIQVAPRAPRAACAPLSLTYCGWSRAAEDQRRLLAGGHRF